MGAAQRVRCKPDSRAARDWQIAPDAVGTVMCRYRILLAGTATPERMDVRFSPNIVIWGGCIGEFELVEDGEDSAPREHLRN